jgi:hypothetical protein
MKVLKSAFYSDSIQLTLREVKRLLLGRIVEETGGGMKIGLYSMPDNGCPCENCRRVIGKSDKKNKETKP